MTISNDVLRATRRSIREEVLLHPGIAEAMRWARQHRAHYFPSGGNLGDGLIGLGTQDLFEHFGLELETRTGWETNVLGGIRHLVVSGAGGFVEGLWKDFVRVLEPFFEAGGEAVLLPCTVSGYREFFARYGRQMTVFAREQVSFEHLQSIEALEGRVHLCHDLAFAVDFERTGWPEGLVGNDARLSLLRSDEESRGHVKPRDNIDLALIWNSIQWASRSICMPPLTAAAQLIHQFDEIQTDRLHMSVLAALIGKRVTMRPNAYFKNKAVYDYTLGRFGSVAFVGEHPEGQPAPASGNIWTAYAELEEMCEVQRANAKELSDSRAELDGMRALLAEERARAADTSARLDAQVAVNVVLSSEAEALRARLPEIDFRGSRGYRLWMWYQGLYDRPLSGRALRGARKVGKPLLALRRRKKRSP